MNQKKIQNSFIFCSKIFPATKHSLNENHAIIQENLTYCTKNPIACLRVVHYFWRTPQWDLIYETETEEITRLLNWFLFENWSVHHQLQIPGWVFKYIKNPENPLRKVPGLVSQSAKPCGFRAKQGLGSGTLLQSESNRIKAPLFKNFPIAALVTIYEVVFVVIDLLSLGVSG